ncbi:toll/interleukin-1 receptor domain-containing adapter protein isoform 3-T6 [Ara ararauna]
MYPPSLLRCPAPASQDPFPTVGNEGVFCPLALGLSRHRYASDKEQEGLSCLFVTNIGEERFQAGDRQLSSVVPAMAGWFKRLLHKPKPRSVENSLNASHSASSSPSSSSAESSSSSPSTSLIRSFRPSPMLTSDITASGSARWAKTYDVCICHSEVDLEVVEELVSYLEGQPESFRCFLQLRDAVPGGAVVTELCDAVQNSHCWVMLITPGFLQDPWCKYQMHQALAEAPMANGRTIPVLKDVDRKDYPKELRNLYYIYMKENSFRQIRDTVVRYLQDLCRSSMSTTE